MGSTMDPAGEPIPTSSVQMAAVKHTGTKCRSQNVAFLKCKKDDPNPEKYLDKGRQVTKYVLHLLKNLHQNCGEELDVYAGFMYYHTKEFEICLNERKAFDKACSSCYVTRPSSL